MSEDSFKERVERDAVAASERSIGLEDLVAVRNSDDNAAVLRLQAGLPPFLDVRLLKGLILRGETHKDGNRILSDGEFNGLVERVKRGLLKVQPDPITLRKDDKDAIAPRNFLPIKEALRKALSQIGIVNLDFKD